MNKLIRILFFLLFSMGLNAQQPDSFMLAPDWEVGLSQRYIIEGHTLMGQNAMSGAKQDIESGFTLKVKKQTNDHYIVEFIYDSIRMKEKSDTLAGQFSAMSSSGMDLGPVISWPVSELEMKMGLNGDYLGILNEEQVESEIKVYQEQMLKNFPKLDSAGMSFVKRMMEQSIGTKARDFGRYYYTQLFQPMGKRYPLDRSFKIDQQIPLGQMEMAGLSEYDCKMEILQGQPDTLRYTERALSEGEFMKQVMKMLSENMPEDVGLPDSVNFEEIMGGITSTTMILTEKKFSLDKGLPIYVTTESSTQMNMGMMQGMFSENKMTIRAVN